MEMVNVEERDSESEGHPLGKRSADEERAEESGAAGEGDCREVILGDSGAADSGVNHRDNVLLMGPGGEFGDHTTIFFVDALGGNDIAAENAVDHNGGGGVIT